MQIDFGLLLLLQYSVKLWQPRLVNIYIAFDVLDAFSEAYDSVSDVLASCQLAAFLEVIHPMVGIVKTGVLAPFMQVYFKVYN